jgi:hypothetical protein
VAITNQQILDYLETMDRRQLDEDKRQHTDIQGLSERVGALEKAFNEHLLTSKNGTADSNERLSLIEVGVLRQQANWEKVWKYLLVPVIVAVLAAILAAIGLR